VYLSRPLEQFAFTRTYIKATLSPNTDIGADALWRAATMARGSPAWIYKEIETSHMIASNRPVALGALLSELLRSRE